MSRARAPSPSRPAARLVAFHGRGQLGERIDRRTLASRGRRCCRGRGVGQPLARRSSRPAAGRVRGTSSGRAMCCWSASPAAGRRARRCSGGRQAAPARRRTGLRRGDAGHDRSTSTALTDEGSGTRSAMPTFSAVSKSTIQRMPSSIGGGLVVDRHGRPSRSGPIASSRSMSWPVTHAATAPPAIRRRDPPVRQQPHLRRFRRLRPALRGRGTRRIRQRRVGSTGVTGRSQDWSA